MTITINYSQADDPQKVATVTKTQFATQVKAELNAKENSFRSFLFDLSKNSGVALTIKPLAEDTSADFRKRVNKTQNDLSGSIANAISRPGDLFDQLESSIDLVLDRMNAFVVWLNNQIAPPTSPPAPNPQDPPIMTPAPLTTDSISAIQQVIDQLNSIFQTIEDVFTSATDGIGDISDAMPDVIDQLRIQLNTMVNESIGDLPLGIGVDDLIVLCGDNDEKRNQAKENIIRPIITVVESVTDDLTSSLNSLPRPTQTNSKLIASFSQINTVRAQYG